MHQMQSSRYLIDFFIDNVFFWINPVEKCTRTFLRCYVNKVKVTSFGHSVPIPIKFRPAGGRYR
jgi:hypothetical protein